ncbi:hypothetical protein ACEZCY_37850, partial [Streptacidiphilus sp. N1-12]
RAALAAEAKARAEAAAKAKAEAAAAHRHCSWYDVICQAEVHSAAIIEAGLIVLAAAALVALAIVAPEVVAAMAVASAEAAGGGTTVAVVAGLSAGLSTAAEGAGLTQLAIGSALVADIAGASHAVGGGAGSGGSASVDSQDYDPSAWLPTVTHEDGATAIGNDPETAKALAFAPRIPGVHNLVIHGHPNGFANNTSMDFVAAAMRANPTYKTGMPICMIVCYGANQSLNLFREMKADVSGYNTKLIVNPDGSFAGGGQWQGFTMANDDWAL